MAEIKLVRRWGSHQAGETVEVDDAQGQWLLDTSFGVRPGQEENSRHGGEGVDPRAKGDLAGADPTRRRMTSSPKSPREGERAGRVQGAPRAVGDVTHVADENLGKEHKGDRGDVLLASGKRLSEDLAEQQAELDEQDKKRSSKQGESKDAKSEDGPTASGKSPEGESRKLSQPKK